MNTTNAEQSFEPGDIIEFAGERFLVLRNYGDEGRVREYPLTDSGTFTYRWRYEGEACRKVGVLE